MKRYKDYFLFVAKCLTLDDDPQTISQVKESIQNKNIDWGKVVILSSEHLVLPAMYLQLKRNGLLPELPEDLIEYLEEITQLNKARNLAILSQAEAITKILNKHNISPVFLKGVAHILDGLYVDIAERMLGDIDLLVPKEDMEKAANALIKESYTPMWDYKEPWAAKHRHYPRLQNFNCPASVEIHGEILETKHQNYLRGYELIQNKKAVLRWSCSAFVPSEEHQLISNILNVQLNDDAFRNFSVLLRPIYDFYLQAKNKEVHKIIPTHQKDSVLFSTYFATVNYVFSSPKQIRYKTSIRHLLYLSRLILFFNYPTISNSYKKAIKYKFETINKFRSSRFLIIRHLSNLIMAVFRKDLRTLLFTQLSDKKWFKNQLNSYLFFYRRK